MSLSRLEDQERTVRDSIPFFFFLFLIVDAVVVVVVVVLSVNGWIRRV